MNNNINISKIPYTKDKQTLDLETFMNLVYKSQVSLSIKGNLLNELKSEAPDNKTKKHLDILFEYIDPEFFNCLKKNTNQVHLWIYKKMHDNLVISKQIQDKGVSVKFPEKKEEKYKQIEDAKCAGKLISDSSIIENNRIKIVKNKCDEFIDKLNKSNMEKNINDVSIYLNNNIVDYKGIIYDNVENAEEKGNNIIEGYEEYMNNINDNDEGEEGILNLYEEKYNEFPEYKRDFDNFYKYKKNNISKLDNEIFFEF